jgi:hypothetical protein
MEANGARHVGSAGMGQVCAIDEHIADSNMNLNHASKAFVSFDRGVWKM